MFSNGFSEYDAKTYLAFSNSLSRTLVALGLQPAAAKPPTLADLMREARERGTAA